jgi:hypothetical protein
MDNLTVLNNQITATTIDKIQTVGNDYIIQTENNLSATAYNNLTLYAEKDLQQMNQGLLTVTSKGNIVLGTEGDYTETVDGAHATTVKGNIVLGTEGDYTETVDGAHAITVIGQQTFTAVNLDIKNTVDITGATTVAANVDITGTSTATVDHVSAEISGKGHTHIGSPTAATGAVSNTGTPN